MNAFYIIEQRGYGKLAEKLPDTDKEFLRGFQTAIQMLGDYKNGMENELEQDIQIIRELEKQISECVIENAVRYLEEEHDEILISFVDNNHYSFDENGNIVDDNEEK